MRTSLAPVALVVACRADLPPPEREPPSDPATVSVVPDAPLDALPRVVRFGVAPGEPVDPMHVELVAGEVGPRHLEQIAEADPSRALAERFVPTTKYLAGGVLWLAPEVALEPGERYALALGTEGRALELTVASGAPPPLLRLWPPTDVVAGSADLLLCGASPLGPVDEVSSLEPAGPRGRLTSFGASGGLSCVRFVPELALEAGGRFVPPLSAGAALTPLDPSPVDLAPAEGSSPSPATCTAEEIAIAAGCAVVEDDRMTLRGPDGPLLWLLTAPGLEVARVTRDGSSTSIKGLTPSSSIELSVHTLDATGRWTDVRVAVQTGPARPHFVLNEVYANPVGPEPAQEWIEIVNDGTVAGDLGGLWLGDAAGEVELPSAFVGPGAFAVLVGAAYSEDGEYDAPPAVGSRVVRLEKLGTNGLSNEGEPLRLRDPSGVVLSRFPALPKPKAGLGVARVAPDAPDDQEASFARWAATPGAQNTPGVQSPP